MRATNLTAESLTNPLGLGVACPHLAWVDEDGISQSACQVVCEDENGATLWDTGREESASMQLDWPGEPLASRQHVTWRVRVWDEKGVAGAWSEPAGIEVGLLSPDDWSARWISGDYDVPTQRVGALGNFKQMIAAMHPAQPDQVVTEPILEGRYPVDCFRRAFDVAAGLVRARLYITACGLYEARIDGEKVGGFCMAPGHTDYRKRVQYQAYDVTEALAAGGHELTVQLADGWYRGSCGAWGLLNQYGTQTKLLAQLELTYADGIVERVETGPDWQWSNDGPILFADNKDGEIVDATRMPSYSGHARATHHDVVPTASNNVPVTMHERFSPAPGKTPNGRLLYDLGQNIAGWVELDFDAHGGQHVLLRCGEMLDENGNLTLKNIQCTREGFATPLQQVEYVCREGHNHYRTTFCVFGFRYVEVETDAQLGAGSLTAIALYSDMAQTGSFESSNELLNRFFDATVWSTKGNSLDVPTDCPTRERHGWSGDAQIFFETFSYLFDCRTFERKWLHDLFDWQKRDGKLPQVAPAGGVDSYMRFLDGSVGWADAGVLIPYRYWKHYGDASVLSEFYDGMRRYAEFMVARCGKTGPFAPRVRLSRENRRYLVNMGQCYGEWAEPEDVHKMDWKDTVAPHPEVATAYTAYVLGCMAQIAAELGRAEDEKRYRAYSEGCRRAYQELSQLPEYTLDTDRQARLVRPLAFGLLDESQTDFARERLVRACENYGWRLGTGFLSTPLIMDVLASYDLDAAYRLLENEQMPGWLFMPKMGATTVWESWEGTQAQGGIASLNHYSKGAVCAWLFRVMCGIEPDGERHFTVAPRPGGHFSHARAAYQSSCGRVESGWVRTDGGWRFSVTVPSNVSATVVLPDGSRHEVAAGTHEFSCTIRSQED